MLLPVLALSTTFAFEDARYLRKGEHDGGLVHAPETDEALPLVVFLHGVNEAGPLHRGLGGAFDVRATIDDLVAKGSLEPVAIAGPSQTRDAWTGSRLWSGFDLDAFVDAVDAALPSGSIDRTRVVLAGHSGAGCNATGGLLSPRGTIKPLAMLVLDTCMDAGFGKRFGEAAEFSPVHVFYQTALWPREIAAFRTAFDVARKDNVGTVTRLDVASDNPHEELARVALAKALPNLFPARP